MGHQTVSRPWAIAPTAGRHWQHARRVRSPKPTAWIRLSQSFAPSLRLDSLCWLELSAHPPNVLARHCPACQSRPVGVRTLSTLTPSRPRPVHPFTNIRRSGSALETARSRDAPRCRPVRAWPARLPKSTLWPLATRPTCRTPAFPSISHPNRTGQIQPEAGAWLVPVSHVSRTCLVRGGSHLRPIGPIPSHFRHPDPDGPLVILARPGCANLAHSPAPNLVPCKAANYFVGRAATAANWLVEIGSWTRKDSANPKWLSIADLGVSGQPPACKYSDNPLIAAFCAGHAAPSLLPSRQCSVSMSL